MYGAELYARLRRVYHVEGLSSQEAARCYGLDQRTVAKMLLRSGMSR